MLVDNPTMTKPTPHPSIPRRALLPINRCNLPAKILGSLTFQRHPVALHIDGVATLYPQLFQRLNQIEDPRGRADYFIDYLSVYFLLHKPEEAGAGEQSRTKANYLRLLRGWLFNSDGQEGAVLKSWVESRFGLMPRHHRGPLNDYSGEHYQHYLADRAQGLYNTNALEAQLDLLFAFCQYQLARQRPETDHMTLYRGINRIDEFELIGEREPRRAVLLFNNLNSFTHQRERAGEFGDYILEVAVPISKLLWYPGLLPGRLQGEAEYLVIGGLYEVAIHTY